MQLPQNKKVLRRGVVMERCGLKGTALMDAVKRGEFPVPFKVTPRGRALLWLEQEVDEWLASRLAARRNA